MIANLWFEIESVRSPFIPGAQIYLDSVATRAFRTIMEDITNKAEDPRQILEQFHRLLHSEFADEMPAFYHGIIGALELPVVRQLLERVGATATKLVR